MEVKDGSKNGSIPASCSNLLACQSKFRFAPEHLQERKKAGLTP